EHLQAPDGGSVYLRLSTRPLDQPQRTMSAELSQQIVDGAYWLVDPGPNPEIALVVSGSLVQEALNARGLLSEDLPDLGVLVVTSPGRLQRGWTAARRTGSRSYVDELLSRLPPATGLVTVLDGHSGALSWLGAVCGHRVVPLGVERFGQSGNILELYRAYGLDEEAIVGAVAR